jgi:hypothetical protein
MKQYKLEVPIFFKSFKASPIFQSSVIKSVQIDEC